MSPKAASETVPWRDGRTAQGRLILDRIDGVIGTIVETLAAALVALEIVILFSGIVARYVLHMPIVWSDELSSILFLWLAMLGTTVALRHGAHMRMTAFISGVNPEREAVLEILAIASSAAFLAVLLQPAWELTVEDFAVVTPALEISNAWRLAAIPVGVLLMLFFSGVQLLRETRAGVVVVALAMAALAVAAILTLGPVMRPLGNWNLVIFFVGVVAMTVFAGVPIGFAFGLATVAYLAFVTRVPWSS